MTALHTVYLYERARSTDAGTPDKISAVNSSAGSSQNPLSLMTLAELQSFSPAFRRLVAYHNKGYISLMHVQAQLGQAS